MFSRGRYIFYLLFLIYHLLLFLKYRFWVVKEREIEQHNPKGVIDKIWRNGNESRIEENSRIECLKQIRDIFPHLRDKQYS